MTLPLERSGTQATNNFRLTVLTTLCLFGLGLFGLASVANASPTIQSISVQGLQSGAATVLTISGSELPPDAQVILPLEIARQQVEGEATASRLTISVTLAENVPFGIYPLRIAGRGGISNPIMVGVDRLPQQSFTDERVTLPVALSGTVSGAEVRRVRFQGRSELRLVCDLESRRLGSSLRPAIRLYDARGRQLAWSPGLRRLGGDARLEVRLPADGEYVVEVHDVLYRATSGSPIRLKLGDLQFADRTFPLAVSARALPTTGGDPPRVALIGGGFSADLRVPVELPNWPAPGTYPLGFSSSEASSSEASSGGASSGAGGATGGQPAVILSDARELVETQSDGSPPNEALTDGPMPLPMGPLGVSGRLDRPGQSDRYLLAVRPEARLRLGVQAETLGSNLDGVLTISDPDGRQLARGDDQPDSLDPMVEFTVPANLQHLLVTVSDLQQRGGNDYFYRFQVEELGTPSFSLSLDGDRILVPASGSQVFPVRVTRSNYDGPIHLDVPGLPSGLRLSGQQIPAGAEMGLLTLTAFPPAEAKPNLGGTSVAQLASVYSVLGRASIGETTLVRFAETPVTPTAAIQPWLRRDVAIAVTEAAPLRIEWLVGDVADPLRQGTPRPTTVRITRQEGVSGPIRLRLLTNQVMPKKKITKDNKEEIVDDPDRALRLEGAPTLAADASEISVSLLVPGDLPERDWSLVLIAELLSGDASQVVATATTPVHVLRCETPVAMEMSGGCDAQAVAGAGPFGQLTVRSRRSWPLTQRLFPDSAITRDPWPRAPMSAA